MARRFDELPPTARLDFVEALRLGGERLKRTVLEVLRDAAEEIRTADSVEEAFGTFLTSLEEVEVAHGEYSALAESVVNHLGLRGWDFKPPLTRVKMTRRSPRVKRIRKER